MQLLQPGTKPVRWFYGATDTCKACTAIVGFNQADDSLVTVLTQPDGSTKEVLNWACPTCGSGNKKAKVV